MIIKTKGIGYLIELVVFLKAKVFLLLKLFEMEIFRN